MWVSSFLAILAIFIPHFPVLIKYKNYQTIIRQEQNILTQLFISVHTVQMVTLNKKYLVAQGCMNGLYNYIKIPTHC